MAGELLIGAVDWEHVGWHGSFYPDDLPPEWRLTYYANEFSSLLLPATRWREADRVELEGWCDDVSERFRFVLDVTNLDADDAPSLERLSGCRLALGERLAGAVAWSSPSTDAGERIRERLGEGPFLALAEPAPIWEPALLLATAERVVCVLIPDVLGRDLKRLRRVLESLPDRYGDGVGFRLFFSGTPPSIKMMQEVTILWQLLGGMSR